MGYTVDLGSHDLRCRTKADAVAAVALAGQREDMCPHHLELSPRCMSNPPRDNAWSLEVEHFTGDHWDDDAAIRLWVALAPHLADGASIEFQGEDFYRWRVRWEGGRAVEEYVEEVRWAVNRELQPPQKEGSS